MLWTDSRAIAMKLEDKHSDVDVLSVRFMDLRRYVLDLEGFEDDPHRCNEKILEAIQMAWLDERNA